MWSVFRIEETAKARRARSKPRRRGHNRFFLFAASFAPCAPSRSLRFEPASGYDPALILEAAVRLRVFDVLDQHPMTLDEVVSRTGTSVRGMRTLLNALVGLDLLTRTGDRYALTHESEPYLVSTRPGYQGY